MLENSLDLLYIVLAFCVLGFTVFVCWMLYQFISIVSTVRKISRSIEEKLEKVDELISLTKEKVESSATYITLFANGIEKIIGLIKKHSDKNEAPDEKNKQSKSKAKTKK